MTDYFIQVKDNRTCVLRGPSVIKLSINCFVTCHFKAYIIVDARQLYSAYGPTHKGKFLDKYSAAVGYVVFFKKNMVKSEFADVHITNRIFARRLILDSLN